MDTLFTKIINREIPAKIIYEDDQVLAFHDIAPQAPVHFLVIPKKPIRTLNDLTEDDKTLAGHILFTAQRLARRIPDETYRSELLRAVHYEATRAGLDPQLVLGLIQVESGFKKYALSTAGARGYMQVMPFWTRLIGTPDSNLFHMRTNLRFGCTILRHYLDIEKGDLFRALGRYNGSLGRAEYPNLVRAAWERNWSYDSIRLAQNP